MNIHYSARAFELSSQQTNATVRVVDLKKHFGPLRVLDGISLSAHRGEIISILGSSGSGKSTLLRCLNFLEVPSEGEIWIAGRQVRIRRGSVDQREINAVRAKLGMVFQNFNLWSHKTVLENIVEAPIHVRGLSRKEAILRAEALLDKIGLSDKRHAYPTHLSGGQQQRVAIARALAMEPELLLFDEPTSALDPELIGEVLKVIRTLAEEGCTMLIATHELGFARQVSSRAVFLHQGRIDEDSPSERFFGNPTSPRLRRFLAAHAGAFHS